MSYNRRSVLEASAALGIGTVIAGCMGEEDPAVEGDRGVWSGDATLTSAGSAFETIDPHGTGGMTEHDALHHIYEQLVWRSADGERVPALAEDWERVEDGRFRFYLREGVSFHDGEDFTAEDVEFSFRRTEDPDLDLVSEKQGNLPGVEDVEIIDDYTVDFISDGRNTMVEVGTAQYLGLTIVNKDWMESVDGDPGREANGTGPFRVLEYTPGDRVVMEPFEDYWGDVPHAATELDTFTVNFVGEDSTRLNQLLAGESQISGEISPQDLPRVAEEPGLEIDSRQVGRCIYGAMDLSQEPWSSLEFRQAMNWAVDNEGYVDNVMNGFGTPASQPVPEVLTGHDPDLDVWGYDPERAEELVEESGYAGIELELTVPTESWPLTEEVGTTMVDYIDSLSNVSCDIELQEFTTHINRWGEQDPEMDFYIMAYGHPAWDGRETINSLMLDTDRHSRWGPSPAYDETLELFEESLSAEDPEALTREMNRIVVEDAAIVFMHYMHQTVGYDNDIDYVLRGDETLSIYDAEYVG